MKVIDNRDGKTIEVIRRSPADLKHRDWEGG
jgi:hypothetical protein